MEVAIEALGKSIARSERHHYGTLRHYARCPPLLNEKHPTGAVLDLLNVIRRKGIEILL